MERMRGAQTEGLCAKKVVDVRIEGLCAEGVMGMRREILRVEDVRECALLPTADHVPLPT